MNIGIINENLGLLHHASGKMVDAGYVRRDMREDFVHNLYIELVNDLDSYDDKYSLSTWVYMVARRVQQRMTRTHGSRRRSDNSRHNIEYPFALLVDQFDPDKSQAFFDRIMRDAGWEEPQHRFEISEAVLDIEDEIMQWIELSRSESKYARAYSVEELKDYMKTYLWSGRDRKAVAKVHGLSPNKTASVCEIMRKIVASYVKEANPTDPRKVSSV